MARRRRPARVGARRCLALACAAGLVLAACRPSTAEPHASPPPRVRVDTIKADAKPVPRTLAITGTLEALVETDLAANASGRVVSTSVDRGDEVKKGALLAELDVRLASLQAAAAKAQVDVSSAQASLQAQECARLAKLAAAGAVPAAETEKQQWQCKVSNSALSASQLQASLAAQVVRDGRIRAPFDAWVVERWVDSGEYVRPDSRVVTLVSLDPLRLKLTVPEQHLSKLGPDLAVSFRVAAWGARTFTAKVVRVSPIVRPATRDVIAEAEVANPDKVLRPGMFADVALPLGETPAPLVPKSAVFTRDGAIHLFAVRDGRIEERAVQLGPALPDGVAILAGLEAGEAVVRAPGPDVKNGLVAD